MNLGLPGALEVNAGGEKDLFSELSIPSKQNSSEDLWDWLSSTKGLHIHSDGRDLHSSLLGAIIPIKDYKFTSALNSSAVRGWTFTSPFRLCAAFRRLGSFDEYSDCRVVLSRLLISHLFRTQFLENWDAIPLAWNVSIAHSFQLPTLSKSGA